MIFQEKSLQCCDCGISFTFTAGEQEFYQSKGFTNEPRRCPSCRRVKKEQRISSGNYSHNSTWQINCAFYVSSRYGIECGAYHEVGGMGEFGYGVEVHEERKVRGEFETV